MDAKPTVKMISLPRPVGRAQPVIGDRYELRCELGTGGMATVHLAYDTRLERLVALKQLSAHLASDADHVERFYREAIMLASIESPYVVPVYDVSIGAQPYLVMRHIEGRTLAQELSEHTRMNPVRAVHTVVEVLQGLLVLHERRMLHRDVKPSNVMRSRGGQIVLLDLGVARDLRRSALTRPGLIVGTEGYMSPEQASGGETVVDERSDIYQVGLLFAHLLTGSLDQPRPADLTTAPPVLTDIVHVATGKIEYRYRSVREMIAALQAGVRRVL